MQKILDRILYENNIDENWQELKTGGLANFIFMTENYIIRIPSDHEAAVPDALTESVAAPIAYAHGIRTPRLIRFDNSHRILDKSYSIWERVKGISAGLSADKYTHRVLWYDLGCELGKLHSRVKSAEDPHNWLDSPDRDYTKSDMLDYFKETDTGAAGCVKKLINTLYTDAVFEYTKYFVHGDMHDENYMCTEDHQFLALIDWGDAGWGDPAIDFYMIPPEVIETVLSGYAAFAGYIIDLSFIRRIVLDKIWTQAEAHICAETIYASACELMEKLERGLPENFASFSPARRI